MSENNNIVIKLENISKRYNVYRRNIDRIKGVIFGCEPEEVRYALNNVSLEIKKGERVIIFGHIDSGRTTFLKVLSGITKPSKGKLYVNGTMNVMLDSRVGLDMEFTCRENIYMKANVVGLKRSEIEPYIDDILKFARVEKYADIPVKRAPKGTVSLISTAVHLYKDSDIIICDEVFGGGGSRVSSECEKRMEEYLEKRPDTTLIKITNRLAFARNIGTRFLAFNDGTIVCDGSLDEAKEVFSSIGKK